VLGRRVQHLLVRRYQRPRGAVCVAKRRCCNLRDYGRLDRRHPVANLLRGGLALNVHCGSLRHLLQDLGASAKQGRRNGAGRMPRRKGEASRDSRGKVIEPRSLVMRQLLRWRLLALLGLLELLLRVALVQELLLLLLRPLVVEGCRCGAIDGLGGSGAPVGAILDPGRRRLCVDCVCPVLAYCEGSLQDGAT